MSALWKYNVSRHAWEHERSLSNSTAEEKVEYLKLFQRDEPAALFTIADKKPSVRPASDPLTFFEEEAKRRKRNKQFKGFSPSALKKFCAVKANKNFGVCKKAKK